LHGDLGFWAEFRRTSPPALFYEERGVSCSPFQEKKFFLFLLLVGGGRGRWEGG